MSKATKGTSTLFPQVSRGESNDAAKGLLDDAGDSSGDEAHYGSESLLPRAIAAWSFADAAATAALPAKCSSSAPFGATFADDRRLATRFQDIVTLWQRKYRRLC